MSGDGAQPPRGRGRIGDDVDEEIRYHLERRAAALIEAGMDPAAARDEAERRFGDIAATRRACVASDLALEHGRRRREFLGDVWQDLAHGMRQLRARPLFALATVLTLAVGIGASTAIFGAADHVLLRPLPYRDVERVVTLWEAPRGDEPRALSPANFLDCKARSRSFESMGLLEPSGHDLTGSGPPEPVSSWRVSEGLIEALGVRPLLGRSFQPEEFVAGAAPVVMLSEGLWRRRFGSDPAVVGRAIQMDGAPATVVGIVPHTIAYPERKELWTPKVFRPDELNDRRSSYMFAVARLRPGVMVEQARADLAGAASAMAREFPRTNSDLEIAAVPIAERVLGPVRPALFALLGAVALMLLIACANVAGLLLARGAERQPELATRAALGAEPGRLARQLLTECLLIAGLGGALGLALAWWGTGVLVALGPPDLPRLDEIGVDARVLAFGLGITLVSAILFGLFPALRFSRPEFGTGLGSGVRATADRGRARLRSGLVMTEIALALMLVAGAGLLIRSFTTLVSNDLGFVPEGRVAVQTFLWDRNPTPEQRLLRADQIAASFRSLPGVRSVGWVSSLPFHPSQIDAQGQLVIEGRAAPGDDAGPPIYTTFASPDYFRAAGIPLVRGRRFEERDGMNAPRVAIVSQALARRWFPGEDPIGKRVTFGVMAAPETREIVGVVGDVRPRTFDSEPCAEAFIPFGQSASGSITYLVHTAGDAATLVPRLRQKLWDIDPDQTIYHAATVESLIEGTLLERRFNLLLIAVFSGIALILAGVGVYALISVTARQRTHEIGVRLALGARPRDIVGMVVGQGLRLAVPGVAVGIVGAFLLTRFMERMLYHVRPGDPATLAQAAALMIAVAVVGSLIPALRAALTDPVRAMRGT